MSASTPNVDLQQRINVLRTQYGDNSEGLRDAVAQLLQREGLGQTSLGGSSYGAAPSTPVAGLSQAGASTPLLHSSRSGRIIKPSKPFTTPAAAARPSPYPASHHRPSSSLNPNRAPPPPPRLPLSTSAAPVPPLTAITETRYQAQYTTYPSRMRLGTSSLMQPNALAASGKGDNTPAAAGKRSRAAVNYAELEGISAEVAEEEPKGGMVPKRGLVPGTPGGAAVEAKQAWGDGKSYLGVLPPGNMVIVQQAIKTKHQVFSEDHLEAQAARPDNFVPIQIDLDVDTFKIRDAFVWNANEKLISPTDFARIFCDDLDLPQAFASDIAGQIETQVKEQSSVAEVAIRTAEEVAENIEKDLRVVLNLDVQIGTLHLTDRIEWDLSSSLTPELFASVLVRDLSLSSSAAPLIAHALHEELMRVKKNCLEMGLLFADEQTLKRRGARPLEGAWREWNETLGFGPRVEVLSLDEMDRVEAERERAQRRAKRDRLTGSRTGGRRR